MTSSYNYWAQALDNSSPDHIILNGKETLPEDQKSRSQVASQVSNIIKKGTRLFEGSGLRLTVDSHQFVIEIPSIEVDVAGRTAPIICAGDFRDASIDHIASEVSESLLVFASKINRTLSPEYSELTFKAFEVLKKKLRTRRLLLLTFSVVSIALLLQAISYLMRP